MKSTRRQRGRNGMELAEEAVHLLRMNAGAVLPAYYIGTLPFVFCLLYFWADMSRSPYAVQHIVGESLGLAVLFLGMKFWQAISMTALRSRIMIEPLPPATWRRALRIFLIQTAIQPSAVLLLPLAALPAALPLPWVYAFYQNVTALGDGETGEIRKVLRRSARQAAFWPGQNLLLLVIMAAFSLCVLINVASFCQLLPHLLKMLLGIESVYTQSPMAMFNTTFVAASFGLTYLCVDPILKTTYLLRCFYGESLDSGEDLKAELRHFGAPLKSAIALLLLLASLFCATFARAEDTKTSIVPAKSAPPAAVPAPDLDHAINDVIHQSKYTWRMPRETVVKETVAEEGPIGRFIDRVWEWIKRTGKSFVDWIQDLYNKWIKRHPTPTVPMPSTGHFEWARSMQAVYFVLLVVVVCALVFFIYKVWWRGYRREEPVASEAIQPVPDLTDENVGADQLPEDGWLKLGRELLGRGELRLALRAFYFASLTHLAARNLITIAKFKSNRDYERELSRRGHSMPDVLSLFGENVSVFDASWYGLHEVNQALVTRFLANVERLKGF